MLRHAPADHADRVFHHSRHLHHGLRPGVRGTGGLAHLRHLRLHGAHFAGDSAYLLYISVSPCGALIRLPACHYPPESLDIMGWRFPRRLHGAILATIIHDSPLNQGRVRLDDSNTIESNSSVSTPPGGT